MYSTSQICTQCLTELICLLVVVEWIFKNSQYALQYHFVHKHFESDQPAFQFIPPRQIPNLWAPLYSRLWSLPKMNMTWFLISATLYCKSFSMLSWLQWIKARSGLLLWINLDMRCHGDSIYTVELKQQAALASYVSFVFRFFAIHQNMGPAQWGNTSLQKLPSRR
jgi:hypothetical protein